MQDAIVEHQPDRLSQSTAMASVEQSRAIQEAQAAFVIAKQFPRDEVMAEHRILEACKRPRLAEQGEYAYPRGGQQITGPSIRLAEVMARYWGNLNYGIRELSNANGVSEMETFCHDLETNVRAVRIFHSKHVRFTRKDGNKALTDPRDIYENNANHGARRLRACILEVIPGDVVDAAVSQCHLTLQGNSDKPIIDRIKDMVKAFETLGVTSADVEERMGKNNSALLEIDLVKLRQIYNSVNDGMSKAGDWFGAAEDDRPAIKMPQEVEPQEPSTTEEAQPDAEDAKPPKAAKKTKKAAKEANPENVVVGVVETVTCKPTKGNDKHSAKIEALWYYTFSETFGKMFEDSKESGTPVSIEYKETQYGNEVVNMEVFGG